jgi:hypothetical protein
MVNAQLMQAEEAHTLLLSASEHLHLLINPTCRATPKRVDPAHAVS